MLGTEYSFWTRSSSFSNFRLRPNMCSTTPVTGPGRALKVRAGCSVGADFTDQYRQRTGKSSHHHPGRIRETGKGGYQVTKSCYGLIMRFTLTGDNISHLPLPDGLINTNKHSVTA